MSDANPYSAPETTAKPPVAAKTARTHGASVRAEAWRGAKFGGRVITIFVAGYACLVGIVILAGLVLDAVTPGNRLLDDVHAVDVLVLGLQWIASVVISIAGGAAVGAGVMSLAAIVRRWRA